MKVVFAALLLLWLGAEGQLIGSSGSTLGSVLPPREFTLPVY
jgi:hypothetical protein